MNFYATAREIVPITLTKVQFVQPDRQVIKTIFQLTLETVQCECEMIEELRLVRRRKMMSPHAR